MQDKMPLSASSKNWSFLLLTHKHCPHLCVCTRMWCLLTYVLCIQEVRSQHPVSSLPLSALFSETGSYRPWSSPLTGIAGSEVPGAASFLGWQEQTITQAFHRGSGDPEQQALHSPSVSPASVLTSETACLDFFFRFVLFCFKYCQLLGHQGG